MNISAADIDILSKFEALGNSASFHYADDTCKEWGIARGQEGQAIALYKQHPELRERMMLLSKGFLWSLKTELET